MLFREMARKDPEQYVPVFLKAFRGEPWNEPWTQEAAVKRLEQFMGTGSFFGLALEEDDEIIAFVLGQYEQYYDGLRFYIQEFCCARQGSGYGTKLLSELENRLREQGVVRTYLMTIRGDATEGYYQRRGYTTDGDAVWMYRKL